MAKKDVIQRVHVTKGTGGKEERVRLRPLLLFRCSVASASLEPRELQHARLSSPFLSPAHGHLQNCAKGHIPKPERGDLKTQSRSAISDSSFLTGARYGINVNTKTAEN